MNVEDYKKRTLRIIELTNDNPVAPFALHQFENGVEQWIKVLVPLSNKDNVQKYCDALLGAFTDEKLKEISSTPDFIIALLACAKTSTINFIYKK